MRPAALSYRHRMSQPDLQRYARHLLLPGVGVPGQRRLAQARVLVVGAGGLGSPALLYLAAAGVGTIGIADDDVVDVTNLQRQVVHTDADTGRSKVDSAAAAIARLNPHVQVVPHAQRVTAATAAELVAAYQLVVDGSDNFATRYLVGDACARAGIPHVWASVLRFDAQVAVWWAGHGPCYRCVFPQEPQPGQVPSCADAGVLGALCGVIGSIQATEALKLLLGIGDPLVGRLLVHDALAQTWDTITVRPAADCPTCASAPPPRPAVTPAPPEGPAVLSAAEVAAALGASRAPLLVDVRTAAERTDAIPGSIGMPLADFVSGHAIRALGPAVARAGGVILYCASGIRSEQAARLAIDGGWPGVGHLGGGLLAWRGEGRALEPVPASGSESGSGSGSGV